VSLHATPKAGRWAVVLVALAAAASIGLAARAGGQSAPGLDTGARIVVETGDYAGQHGEVINVLKTGRRIVALDGYATSQGIRIYPEAELALEEATPEPTATPSPEPTSTPTSTPTPTPTATPTPTPAPGNAELFLAPSGNDSGSCTSSAPCRTMGYAYEHAQPGAVVEMAAGSYGAQNLPRQASKDAAAERVVFRPAASADVQLSGLSFGADYDDPGAWHVEVRGLTVNGSVDLRRTNDVVLRDVRLDLVFGFGADRTQIIGGEWGINHPSKGTHPEFSVWRTSDPVEGLVLDGVHVHHIGRPAGREDVHTNCFHVWGDGHRDIAVRNSHFDHCDVFSSLISGKIDNVRFEGNVFEPSTNTGFAGSAFYSVMLTAGVTNATFKGNRFDMAPVLNQASTPGLVACGNTGAVLELWRGAC
jgi:hypothetical protein